MIELCFCFIDSYLCEEFEDESYVFDLQGESSIYCGSGIETKLFVFIFIFFYESSIYCGSGIETIYNI